MNFLVSIRVRRHERCEHIHDKDGLQNHCALLVMTIDPVHHAGYGFKNVRKKRTNKLRPGVGGKPGHDGDACATTVPF
jgi:hypothetical protein